LFKPLPMGTHPNSKWVGWTVLLFGLVIIGLGVLSLSVGAYWGLGDGGRALALWIAIGIGLVCVSYWIISAGMHAIDPVLSCASFPPHSDYRPVENVSSLSAPYGPTPLSVRLGVVS
jgi:hypothetical protein